MTSREPAIWLIRLAALVGLLITGYLFVLAARGAAPLGCGETSGCADVLASRWAKVWRFPVSLPAMIAYLVVLAASLHAGPTSPAVHRRMALRLIGVAAVAAGGAAIWFIVLQLFVLQHICVFCMAAHACSLLMLLAALWRGTGLVSMLGLLGAGALVAVQLLMPPPAAVLGQDHIIGGLDPHNAPAIGDADAPHVVGLLYDYNCYYCLQTHQYLQQALERYPGQIVVVLLPTAIDPACNPHVQHASPMSLSSCAIARLLLAVWIADPGQVAAFDAYLVEQVPRVRRDGSVPPAVVETVFREEAERLVGQAALAQAMTDPRIDGRLERSATVYDLAADPIRKQSGVPRVIIGGYVYPSFESAQQLLNSLQAVHPELKPAPENR